MPLLCVELSRSPYVVVCRRMSSYVVVRGLVWHILPLRTQCDSDIIASHCRRYRGG
jgi:hypothetical protein